MSATTPALTDPVAGYAPPDAERPLGGYLVLSGTYAVLLVAAVAALRRSGRTVPERVSLGDVLLVAGATHKLSRLIAKDKVTSFARAPFTEYQGEGGPGEIEEKPRGHGLRHAIGELLVCPYCLGLWIATTLCLGLVANPATTRLGATALSALGISDVLHLVHKSAEERH